MFATGRVLIPSSQALQIVMLSAPSDSEGVAPSGPFTVDSGTLRPSLSIVERACQLILQIPLQWLEATPAALRVNR